MTSEPGLRGTKRHVCIPSCAERVSPLKRRIAKLLSDIVRAKQEIPITQRRLPSTYRIDVERYALIPQRMGLLEGIAHSAPAVAKSRAIAHAQAKTRLGRWLK